MKPIDYLIVGAGFAGVVAAQRLASAGKRCVIVDQRNHLAGNAYDAYDEHGVLYHVYGPHYFRTNSQRILDYLSQFTEWLLVDYHIKSYSDERYWSFPINLNTFEEMIGRASTTEEFEAWLEEHRVPIENPQNSEEVILSQVGHELYERFFRGYTLKQWQREPRDLEASVCGRVPIRTNRDDRYLRETFQLMPKQGYTKMFEKMLAASPDVECYLNTSFEEAKERWNASHIIYTGAIDAYFGSCFGHLPYRSLYFEREHFDKNQLADRKSIAGKDGFWQPTVQVNYPSCDEKFTRIVEAKHVTCQDIEGTTIVREFPDAWELGKEMFYPIPNADSKSLYEKYLELAKQEKGVTFIGRLATYRYYNMDQVVGMALAAADRLLGKEVKEDEDV